jgi:hypothetical protein
LLDRPYSKEDHISLAEEIGILDENRNLDLAFPLDPNKRLTVDGYDGEVSGTAVRKAISEDNRELFDKLTANMYDDEDYEFFRSICTKC